MNSRQLPGKFKGSQAVVVHVFNPSALEAQTGKFPSSKPIWSTGGGSRIAGAIQRKCVSKRNKTQRSKKQKRKFKVSLDYARPSFKNSK